MLPPFLAACRRLPTERAPVWFMRQAGRYMPEYRKIRAEHSILEMCKNPELAAEVTLQPVEALGVDAAIIFADLLLPVEPMGLKLEFVQGEGPVIHRPLRNRAAVEALDSQSSGELGFVGDAIERVVRELQGRAPVIGFAGGLFTLASYMIEGGSSRHFLETKRLMYGDPEAWRLLMAKLLEMLTPFAALQVAAGAEAIQVFDSWAGALSPADYERYVLPYAELQVRQIQSTAVPVIYFSTGGSSYLDLQQKTGADVIGADWRIALDRAWEAIGHETAIQGNLDPAALFAPVDEIRPRVEDILRRAGGRPGHIFNLGHGILPETPVEHVKAVVEMVHEWSLAAAAKSVS